MWLCAANEAFSPEDVDPYCQKNAVDDEAILRFLTAFIKVGG